MTAPPDRCRPLLIAMAGLPGTGKSTCADLIARHLHGPVVDKDDLLELVRHSSIEDELEQGRLAYDLVFSLASRQLANDTSVIVDTCLAFAWLRTKLADITAGHNATMLVVHCICADDITRQRIAARASALPHRNLAEYDRLQRIFEEFAATPDVTVDTTTNLAAFPEHLIVTIEQQTHHRHPARASNK